MNGQWLTDPDAEPPPWGEWFWDGSQWVCVDGDPNEE